MLLLSSVFPSWDFITIWFMYKHSYLFICDRVIMRRNRSNQSTCGSSLFWVPCCVGGAKGFQMEREPDVPHSLPVDILSHFKMEFSHPLLWLCREGLGSGVGDHCVLYIRQHLAIWEDHTLWSLLPCFRSSVMFIDFSTPSASTMQKLSFFPFLLFLFFLSFFFLKKYQ